MIQHITRFALLSSLAWWACSTEAGLDQQAQQVCHCLQPVDSLNQLFASRIQQGQQDEAVEILLDLSEASGEAQTCLKSIKSFHLDAPKEEVVSRLDNLCPEWKAILETLPPEEEN